MPVGVGSADTALADADGAAALANSKMPKAHSTSAAVATAPARGRPHALTTSSCRCDGLTRARSSLRAHLATAMKIS